MTATHWGTFQLSGGQVVKKKHKGKGKGGGGHAPPKQSPPAAPANDPYFLYSLYPPGPNWDYTQAVPVSQNPSKGYDVAATVLSDERQSAAANQTNARLQDGPASSSNPGYGLDVFVTSTNLDLELSGSYGQSQFVRDFYPKNFVQPHITVSGISLSQEDYGMLCEFVHYCQHQAVANGFAHLTQLFVIGRGNKDPKTGKYSENGFSGRGSDGTHLGGHKSGYSTLRVTTNNAPTIMQGYQQDPPNAPIGEYHNQTIRGAHQSLAAHGYIGSMPRIHKQFEYAVAWSFDFIIAAMVEGPFQDAAHAPANQAPTTWLDMRNDIIATGVTTGTTAATGLKGAKKGQSLQSYASAVLSSLDTTNNPMNPKITVTAPSGSSTGSGSSGGGTLPNISGNVTPTKFAQAVLQGIGAPTSQQNITNMLAWETAEGGNWNNSATYNPINTTQTMPGSHVMSGGSSAGVQAYTSWQQGLQATVQTLQNGHYGSIIAALKAGNVPTHQFGAIVGATVWGTGPFG